MIPTIIIHRGDQDYARSVVAQAAKKSTHLIVLGNGQNFATDNMKDYRSSAKEFEQLYEHLSTNGYEAELICFTRWFMLRDLLRNKGIEVCLHLDSDVLLYVNPDSLWDAYDQFDITLSHRCCGSTAFFTLKGLEKVCEFILKVYSHKTSYDFECIKTRYLTRQKHGLPGGVCDMTLLEYYGYKYCGTVGEMMHIVDGSTWDHNINETDQGFLMDPINNIKKISFVDGLPTCHNVNLNRSIIFNTLHFQGPAKRHITGYLK